MAEEAVWSEPVSGLGLGRTDRPKIRPSPIPAQFGGAIKAKKPENKKVWKQPDAPGAAVELWPAGAPEQDSAGLPFYAPERSGPQHEQR